MKEIITMTNQQIQAKVLTISKNDIDQLDPFIEKCLEEKLDFSQHLIILHIPDEVRLSIPEMAMLKDTLVEAKIFPAAIVSSDEKILEYAQFSGVRGFNDLSSLNPPMNASVHRPTPFTGSGAAAFVPRPIVAPPKPEASPLKADDFEKMPVLSTDQAPSFDSQATSKPQQSVANSQNEPVYVRKPLKKGERIRNEYGDIIVLAPVEKGAVIAATGDVFIHDLCEGSVLAGINNNADALIYTNQLVAEALSIGQLYATQDQFKNVRKDIPLKVSSEGTRLRFIGLTQPLTLPDEQTPQTVKTPAPQTEQHSAPKIDELDTVNQISQKKWAEPKFTSSENP